MANGYINELTQVANTKKASIATALLMYKRSDEASDKAINDQAALQKGQMDLYDNLSAQASRNNEIERAFNAGEDPKFTTEELGGIGNVAKGKLHSYGPSIGLGAGAGAIAGIPIGILANALFGKDKGLRASLRSALLGGLIGGGAGALGGGALKFLSANNPSIQAKIDSGLQSMKGQGNIATPQVRLLGQMMRGNMKPFLDPVSPALMAKAQRGEIGIPGVTRDYFGDEPGAIEKGKDSVLNYLIGLNRM